MKINSHETTQPNGPAKGEQASLPMLPPSLPAVPLRRTRKPHSTRRIGLKKEQAILRMKAKGWDDKKIAGNLGISETSVKRYAEKGGASIAKSSRSKKTLKEASTGRILPEEIRQRIVRRRAAGEDANTIAADEGVHVSSVYYHAAKAKKAMTPNGSKSLVPVVTPVVVSAARVTRGVYVRANQLKLGILEDIRGTNEAGDPPRDPTLRDAQMLELALYIEATVG